MSTEQEEVPLKELPIDVTGKEKGDDAYYGLSGEAVASEVQEGGGGKPKKWSAGRLHFNVWLFSLCFALAEGAINSSAIYASELYIGNPATSSSVYYGNGAGYLCFALSSIVAPSIIPHLGLKWGASVGIFGYVLPNLGWVHPTVELAVIANSLGGLTAGVFWVTEGKYVNNNAALYAEATGGDTRKAVSYFNGVFASVLFAILAVMKFFSGFIVAQLGDAEGPIAVFVLYAGVAFVGFLLTLFIIDVGDPPACCGGSRKTSADTVSLGAVFSIHLSDPKMKYHIPFNVCYGMAVTVSMSIIDPLIAKSLGAEWVGYSYGIAGLYSFVFCLVIARISFKPAVIALGVGCFVTFSLTFLFAPNVTSAAGLMILLLLIYTGNSVWMGTFAAVHADYYYGTPLMLVAYATYKFQSAIATALAYFTFSFYAEQTNILLVLIFGIFSFPCYLRGYYMFKKEQNDKTLSYASQSPAPKPENSAIKESTI